MFVESRTTVAEVLTEVAEELNAMANRVIASAVTRRQHPTYVSKRALTEELSQLIGAYRIAAKVSGGHDQLSEALHAKVQRARDEVQSAK